MQARTALAETPGSRFIQESEAALAEQRFGDLLNRLVPHFDVLFEKTSGSGTQAQMQFVPIFLAQLIRGISRMTVCRS